MSVTSRDIDAAEAVFNIAIAHHKANGVLALTNWAKNAASLIAKQTGEVEIIADAILARHLKYKSAS